MICPSHAKELVRMQVRHCGRFVVFYKCPLCPYVHFSIEIRRTPLVGVPHLIHLEPELDDLLCQYPQPPAYA